MSSSGDLYGCVTAIRKDGRDGGKFQIRNTLTTFGRYALRCKRIGRVQGPFSFNHCGLQMYRAPKCDIRIQLPCVSKQHAQIIVDENRKIWLENVSKTNSTELNGVSIEKKTLVENNNVFLIGRRSFRVEYGNYSISGQITLI